MAETLLLWQYKPTQLWRAQVEFSLRRLQDWPEVLNALQSFSASVNQKALALTGCIGQNGGCKAQYKPISSAWTGCS